MATLVDYLTDLNTRLDGTVGLAEKAERALLTVVPGIESTAATIAMAQGTLEANAASLSSSLDRIESGIDTVGEKVASFSAAAGVAAGTIADAVTSIGTSTARVTEHADRMSEHLRKVEEESRATVERLRDYAATELDDLLQRVDQFSDSISGPTAEMLKLAIAEVKDGVLSVEEFARVYGDTMIDIENGKVALRELLQGTDPRQFRKRAQEIRRVNLELAEIMALLTGLQNQAAQGLLDLIRLYQEGEITWKRLLEAARDVIEAAGEESQTGALAEKLEDYLRRSRSSRGGPL